MAILTMKKIKEMKSKELDEKLKELRLELSREKGGGCVLWKERELVQLLLKNSDT